MSAPLSHDDVLFRQRLLRAAGLYDGALDGVWGPRTANADSQWEVEHRRLGWPSFTDRRTMNNLYSLLPRAHEQAIKCLTALYDARLRPQILSGTRTYPEQDEIYRQGRRGIKGERIVTYAKAGQSNHNFGIAWDIGLFTADGAYLTDHPDYSRLGSLWCPPGVEWGGNWSPGKRDLPHWELSRVGYPLAELRRRFEAGEALGLPA